MVGMLCTIGSALCTAAFIVMTGWLAWSLLHRNWAFIDLLLPAGLAFTAAVALACVGQVLRLMARVSDDVWHLRRALVDRSERHGTRAERLPDETDQ